ncbi:tetratricopeptide repeat protein [Qipengyuania marisflavi]|uniref:tetratricopeptide repeat protein n=1 Tax=Qipengyuania marisflavi TaxID=2486356 RepID=UPI001486EA76|nr:tetratricopeptide repeat protein [Qipengyuania marisflavi]
MAGEAALRAMLADGTAKQEIAALMGEAALACGDLAQAHVWLDPGEFSVATRVLGLRMQGRLALRKGNLTAAAKAFDQAYVIAPENPELWVDIGRLRYRGGEQLQAVEAADRAVGFGPLNAEALRFRGELARDAFGPNNAAPWFEAALATRPDNSDLRDELAATLGDAGSVNQALDTLRSTLPNSARSLYLRAVIAARGGNYLLARSLLQRAGSAGRGSPAARMLSAIIDLETGNVASAAQALDRLASEQPDNALVRDLLAQALLKSGREGELVRRYSTFAAGPAGSPYLRTLVGRAYEAMGRRDLAARFLDLAALRNPSLSALPSGANNKGVLAARDAIRAAIAGRNTRLARQKARDLAKRYPGSADALALLGDAEFASGNRRAARRAYATSAQVRQPWALTLRRVAAEPDRARAISLLQTYVRGNPTEGEALALLADAYAANGEWHRAADLLDAALVNGMARVPWVLGARSVAARQLGDSAAALEFALAAHDMQPMNEAAIAALIAALPDDEADARSELEAKLGALRLR